MSAYWDAIEPVWNTINIYEGGEVFLASTQGIPRPLVLLYAAHFCQSEIHNGGFLQFFWNNTGVLAPEAIQGFQLIDMVAMAELVTAAASPLGIPYPRDREARWDALISSSEPADKEFERAFSKASSLYQGYGTITKSLGLDELDRRFWELAGNENGGFQQAADRYISESRRQYPT